MAINYGQLTSIEFGKVLWEHSDANGVVLNLAHTSRTVQHCNIETVAHSHVTQFMCMINALSVLYGA